ncbi:Gtr1/RagA G protein Gtr2 [Cristinia sonorae]|uniref:GTP-binding protein n=1 Tax=Cristinia sonorae TaxID=1940300 RepID=A0A8K0UQ02_9AGAR|nr:Gtr1/RagA G protein Gtr2 [Cristinia sonorae]
MATSNGYGSISTTNLTTSPRVNGDADTIIRTKILLLGLRRSGKTSIYEHLFNDLSTKQTFYLEMTTKVTRHTDDTAIPLEIWDCPGNINLESIDAPLSQFSTLIFVIDIQDLYQQPIAKLVDCVVAVYQENPNMNLEVFVHKGDALSEDYKWENFRHIQSRVLDELIDVSPEYEQINMNFHLTSIYDHSLREAFSKVLQRLVDSLPAYEELINVFCANSQSSKAFLFDTKSRLYIATDNSPVDPQDFGLCSDYLQMLNAFGPLYRSISASPPRHRVVEPLAEPSPGPSPDTSPVGHLSVASSASQTPKVQVFPIPSASPTPPQGGSSSSSSIQHESLPGAHQKPKQLFYPSASTSLLPSSSTARTLTYYLITPRLALLALLPTSVFEERRGLVEYNVVFLREGVQEICEVEEEARRG